MKNIVPYNAFMVNVTEVHMVEHYPNHRHPEANVFLHLINRVRANGLFKSIRRNVAGRDFIIIILVQ